MAPASKDMKSAADEGSGAMERVVYIYYLPAPTAFDPNLCVFEACMPLWGAK